LQKVTAVASITVRNLDERLKRKLRVRAAHRNHSMADEVRDILRAALAHEPGPADNLADAMRRRFEPLGGFDLSLPKRRRARGSSDYA
jgi:antitoxin FitA